MSNYMFEVKQGGQIVAKGFAPSRYEAEREANHYAIQYSFEQGGLPVVCSVRGVSEAKQS